MKFPREVNSIVWSQDDSVLFIADSSGKINLFDGQVLESMLDQPLAELSGAHTSRCECIAVHPDNQSFVSGGQDSMIVFWDMYELMSSGSVSTNDYQVRKLAYSAKGDYLAAIFFDEIKKKW